MKRSRVSFDSPKGDFLPKDPVSNGPETPEEAARRVLFSDSLEEKLRPVNPSAMGIANADDLRADSRIGIEPGRPDFLRFATAGQARPTFPAAPGLVDEKNRGVLLHFFANHELLAAELMALALLRFPEAPEAFRVGLLQTLKEEQRHTRWYINRLQKCGVEFGEYPVNRYFWDAVSGMENPLDYVSRLSLTFEQANLDYAKYYSEMLGEAGDTESAAILHRIYRDEISHVGYGLHWFRKWKHPESSDWSALEKQLIFPLSPSRAKGNGTGFNREGRRDAGFDEDYIRQLALFERSNGRTPNVFYFNPEAENRIATFPKEYHPPKRVLSVMEDLEILAAFLARRDDVLLMRRPPSAGHLEFLGEAGFVLPEIEPLSPDGSLPESALIRSRKINQFRPWAIGPDLPSRFGVLTPSKGGPPRSLTWNENDRALFSKIEQTRSLPSWFGGGFPVQSSEDVGDAIAHFSDSGCSQILLKRPFSTAGGGMKRLSLDELKEFEQGMFSARIAAEGGILLEPFHERVFDFSVQMEIQNGKARLIGTVEQIIAPSGGYRGTVSVPRFCSGLDPEFSRFLMTEALPVYQEGEPFCLDLEKWAAAHDYEGPLGIDSYLYRDREKKLCHRVICEINPRFTMGRVAWEIRRQIAPGFGVKMEIEKAEELRSESGFSDQKNGSRSFYLTESVPHSRFAAKITIAKNRADL